MKKPKIVKIEGPLAAEALRILRQIPGIQAEAQPRGYAGRPDFVLHFAGRREPVLIEVKRTANAATARQLIATAGARPKRPLILIAGETTAEARDILDEHGIGVIDGLGNAHVELPGLLLHIQGDRPRRQTQPATKLRGKAGVVAQALLLEHERPWQIDELAQRANVSVGLAHRIMKRLQDEGVAVAEGVGPQRVRRIPNPAALLDLWTEEMEEKPRRTFAHLLAQTPRALVEELGTNLARAGFDHALTGAAAAMRLAPFVTAVPVAEVWVNATTAPDALCDGAHADPVTEGHNVVFLQAKDDAPLAFREKMDNQWLANRFRIYADLRRDPRRGREQADNFRREVIGF